MSDQLNRNVGMAAGAVSPSRVESPVKLAADFQKHFKEDHDGNIWFSDKVDLNSIREQIGDENLHAFLASLCGKHTVKLEELSAEHPLPFILAIGSDYNKLRAAAKRRDLLTKNTRVSHAPAAFASLPQNAPFNDAITATS